ncbi:MAG TPA: ATP-binding protein, partial [Cryomorphaceae bacterium]|nr:ATP-binding protein [Cryomorphaceae bacterium]
QSDDGLMYFGTSDGLVEYDGVSWKNVFGEVHSRNETRCLAKDQNGRVFYAGTDAFGYLEVDKEGGTRPVSLFHLIPEDHLPLGLISSFQLSGDYIYLQAREYLLRLEMNADLTLKSFNSWKTETAFMYSFFLDQTLYIHQIDKGMYKLVEDELELMPGTEVLGKERLQVMLPYTEGQGKEYILGSFSSGFYLWDGQHLQKVSTELDPYLNKGAQLYKGQVLKDGNYALSVIGAGVVVMNPSGGIVKIISPSQGLQTSLVLETYLDNLNGLWILTEKGMARIEINAPALFYGEDAGISFNSNCIENIRNDLFVGTHNGLLNFDREEKIFRVTSNTNAEQIVNLLRDGEDLIIPGSQLQVLRNGKTISLENPIKGSRPINILISKYNPNILFVGHLTGLAVYRRGSSLQTPWEYLGEVAGIDRAIYYLEESREGELWASTNIGITFQVSTPENIREPTLLNEYTVKKFEIEDGEGLINELSGEIYARSQSGVRRFSKSEGAFVKATEFDSIASNIIDILQDPLEKVWVETKAGEIFLVRKNLEGNYEKDPNQGPLGQYMSRVNYLNADSSFLFGSMNGLVRYDPKKEVSTEKPFFTLIRRMQTKTDTLALTEYGRNSETEARSMKDNSLRFEFAAPYFEKEKQTQYQTFLEGFDTDWIDWNDNTFKEYTNLSPGAYTFRVRAQNNSGKVSEEAVFDFVVLPPWYTTWWAYLMYGLLAVLSVTAIVKWRSKKLKAENRILEERVNERTAALEESITELKATQAQLIQSEKMASLGELTSGIAHEIQNPLNFVNNFSEVSSELVDEVIEEVEAVKSRFIASPDARVKTQHAAPQDGEGLLTEAEAILTDVKSNLQKITHHGKRADAIVKGMLAHSRSGKGEKVPTDLNALAEEYLKLSYHGLRAKDKSFNADFKTDFDPNLPKINVVPQDIGRVLLNLINNAFQAVHANSQEEGSSYKPEVTITSKLKANGQQLIAISDNGPGIPDDIKDKIFQPFFTTKPTGQGTGLGLSLSYDIVKAHGGELKVEATANQGSTFVITLPR